MRTLVTGAAGFIGSGLARRLARDGHDVLAFDTFQSSGQCSTWHNLIDFTGDVITPGHRLDLDGVRENARRFGPFDVIFHQAAVTGVISADGSASAGDDAHAFLRNNVEQFRLLLDFALDVKSRVVWASSCSVYGRAPAPMRETDPYDPLNIYAFSKVQCERLARVYATRSTMPVVGLRYSNVYGPGEAHKGRLASMIHQLATQMRAGNRPRIFTAGQQRRDFVYIDDVIEANLRAARATSGGVFNAGAGRSWSFNEVVVELNRALGTRLEPEYFANPYAFTQDHTECDMTLASRVLGHVPSVDLREGIDRYLRSGKLGV